MIFLDTSSHLYKSLCPSVGRSVGRSVRPAPSPLLRGIMIYFPKMCTAELLLLPLLLLCFCLPAPNLFLPCSWSCPTLPLPFLALLLLLLQPCSFTATPVWQPPSLSAPYNFFRHGKSRPLWYCCCCCLCCLRRSCCCWQCYYRCYGCCSSSNSVTRLTWVNYNHQLNAVTFFLICIIVITYL